MAWGGRREGSGRRRVAEPKKRSPYAAPKALPPPAGTMAATTAATIDRIIEQSRMSAGGARVRNRMTAPAIPINPFTVARHPKAATPPKPLQMAMDNAVSWAGTEWAGAILNNLASEGLFFLGFPFLSELAQRPEYRVISETIATEMTRKWIKFAGTGDEDKTDKIKELVDFLDALQIRDRFADVATQDGFFGRSHIYCDSGADDDEITTPIGNERVLLAGKVTRGFLKRLQVVEPVWCYPTTYNASNPLSPDWYNPQVWYVMGKQIHRSRLPTFIGRPVPDVLKPAYSFGGLSMSQLAKPYVDIWLTTRESVAQLIHSFSIMVLMTDLATLLQPGVAGGLLARAQLFNALRDNQGLMIVNKNTEDFKNVSASLAGLHELQAQSQEHMMSVARIPAVKFTGIQPQGLNASSEGEMRAFNDTIKAYQHKLFKPNLDYIIDIAMVTLWGEKDPEIRYEFESLVELTDKEQGELRKLDAEVGQIQIDKGVISPAEERKRIVEDPESLYQGLDPDDVPDLAEEENEGLVPEGGGPDGGGGDRGAGAQDANILPFGQDEFREGDHPRGQPGNAGQFGPGGGGKTPSATKPSKSSGLSTAPLKTSGLKRVGEQMGSNPGGVFEDKSGKRFYIKAGRSPEHVKTELAAAKLYGLAGVPTLKYRPVEGGEHIATEMAKLDKARAGDLSPAEIKRAQQDFIAHAWLANWDAVGTGGDNLGTVAGVPTALDLGGALTYRAQGAPKGSAFGDKVGEFDSLRSKTMNRDAAKVFGDMAAADLKRSAANVIEIPDGEIRDAVAAAGLPEAVAKKLIARKADIGRRVELLTGSGDPKGADSTVVFNAGEPLPVKTLNGIAFDRWEPPEDWATVDGQIELDEPELVAPKGKDVSSGLLIREPDGRVWLMRPSGGFGGYEHTFPKGRQERGLSLQANAIKEAFEETGLKAKITGLAGDHEGDLTVTRFYTAEREGGSPEDHGSESDGVVLAPAKRMGDFLNRDRDRKIAKTHLAGDEFNPSDHPHAPAGSPTGGQFVAAGGGGGGSSKEGEEVHPLENFQIDPAKEGQKYTPKPTFKTKKEHAAHLLTQPGGVTTAEILKALSWPSISMPQMAKTLGMKLEKTKSGGVTKYVGTPMSKEELAAAKAAPAPGKPAQAAPAPIPAVPTPQAAKPAPAAPPAIEVPTPAEIDKAKKTVALKLEYVPGAPKTAAAQKLVDAFNASYADKPMTSQSALVKKVEDFKKMQAAMIPLMNAEQQKAAAAQAENLKKQAAAQAAAAEAAKAEAKAYADKMKDPKVKESYETLAAIMGGGKQAKQFIDHATMKIKSAGLTGKIEPHEAAAIIAYSGSHYRGVNDQLRAGMITEEQFKYTKVLNKALDKLPEHEGTTYRKADLPKAVADLYKPGYIVPERAFTSSSKTQGTWSGGYNYVIEGKGGRDISSLSSHASENEVLFKSGTHFMVVKREGNQIHLKEME